MRLFGSLLLGWKDLDQRQRCCFSDFWRLWSWLRIGNNWKSRQVRLSQQNQEHEFEFTIILLVALCQASALKTKGKPCVRCQSAWRSGRPERPRPWWTVWPWFSMLITHCAAPSRRLSPYERLLILHSPTHKVLARTLLVVRMPSLASWKQACLNWENQAQNAGSRNGLHANLKFFIILFKYKIAIFNWK